MLWLEMVNQLDRLNVNVVRMGGGNAKTHPILPPGSKQAEQKPHVAGGRMGFEDYMAQVGSFFSNL